MTSSKSIAIIGGGPAGLMAAEMLSAHGYAVTIYDHKPSLARKFLMAGRGGLNLTHSEALAQFVMRYGTAAAWLAPHIQNFPPAALIDWCERLGEATFIGSSGRVFPKSFKASPLLRAWLQRLEQQGVQFNLNSRWHGWNDDKQLLFSTAEHNINCIDANATLLALGGASWPRLGSDGGWVPLLGRTGVTVNSLRPANCGFVINWSDIFRSKFIGQPLKSITLSFGAQHAAGELMMTDYGLEGGPLYALSAVLRDAMALDGSAILQIDLKPNISLERLIDKLQQRGSAQSLANVLRKLGLSPVAIGLIMERTDRQKLSHYPAAQLAQIIKSLPVALQATAPIDRAISTAGGIALPELNENLMLKKIPGVFAAGEMLDWEAPTGGYLLQACFATGVAAANGIMRYIG